MEISKEPDNTIRSDLLFTTPPYFEMLPKTSQINTARVVAQIEQTIIKTQNGNPKKLHNQETTMKTIVAPQHAIKYIAVLSFIILPLFACYLLPYHTTLSQSVKHQF